MVEPQGLPSPPSAPSLFFSETPATGAAATTAPFVGTEAPLLAATTSAAAPVAATAAVAAAAAAVAVPVSAAAAAGLDEDCFLEGAALEHLKP